MKVLTLLPFFALSLQPVNANYLLVLTFVRLRILGLIEGNYLIKT